MVTTSSSFDSSGEELRDLDHSLGSQAAFRISCLVASGFVSTRMRTVRVQAVSDSCVCVFMCLKEVVSFSRLKEGSTRKWALTCALVDVTGGQQHGHGQHGESALVHLVGLLRWSVGWTGVGAGHGRVRQCSTARKTLRSPTGSLDACTYGWTGFRCSRETVATEQLWFSACFDGDFSVDTGAVGVRPAGSLYRTLAMTFLAFSLPPAPSSPRTPTLQTFNSLCISLWVHPSR